MASSYKSGHILIVNTSAGRYWHWRMLDAERHVLCQSQDFTDRDACELDALKHDLPVVGLSRKLSKDRKALSALKGPAEQMQPK